jgi:SAM-dependent methyltransferase
LTRVNPVAAAGFSSAADVYERARPSYPLEAIAWLAERTGLGPGRTVVDLAAGTGKLTRLLIGTGARVVAVEPLAEMRALIPGGEVLDGTAEEVPLADGVGDVVTVAQALHWFDLDRALPEIDRILRPGGWLALVWNMRDLDDPVQRGVEELLAPARHVAVAHDPGDWRDPMARSPLFGEPEVREFANVQHVSAAMLRERVASTSFVAAMADAEREALLDRVTGLVAGVDEPFPFPYRTEVHVFPRSRDRAAAAGAASNEG